ncbi:hypothetical protein EII17_06020 [Clostridiales bacterium COT073_COT-073]|nr:hypothetical protein EII17_06020 [Clostridiales bacterium COT073_COT-073]
MKESIFFDEHLDLDYPGMEAVKQAVIQKDYETAKKEFAKYIRSFLKPDLFFQIPYEEPENIFRYPQESDKEACERIIHERTMISVGVPCHFDKNKPIDWHANPTENQYKEWTWQLNRHNEIKMMAHEFRHNHDPEYAKTAIDLIHSWIKQAICPGDVSGRETKSWRTIECGIRMGANWPYILFSFFESEYFTDQFLYEWYGSVWEHGNRLVNHSTRGNWLIMEMNGLAHIGILYPQFKQSKLWLETAFYRLTEELKKQFYPDGFQYELTTCYHEVAINNYQRLIETARAFAVPVPVEILAVLEKAYEIHIKLMMPDGKLPDINDGKNDDSRLLSIPKQRIIKTNSDLNWLIDGRKTETEPLYLSLALPYSGYFIMRNSWQPNATWALFDGAPFGRSHQHEDKLSLLIYANNRLLITEGGNYAYDDSEMRKYVLSTRAHNTIRVDGGDQNRRENYQWHDHEISKKANLKWNIGTNFDYAESYYNEAYQGVTDDSVIHQRNVYFVKKASDEIAPFFIVVDRISAQKNHVYQLLWHIDSEVIGYDNSRVETKDMNVLLVADDLSVQIICGQTEPEWQGYIATGTAQGMYRPVPCISAQTTGNSKMIVSILSPNKPNVCKASWAEADDDLITIHFSNNSKLCLSEEEMKSDK